MKLFNYLFIGELVKFNQFIQFKIDSISAESTILQLHSRHNKELTLIKSSAFTMQKAEFEEAAVNWKSP